MTQKSVRIAIVLLGIMMYAAISHADIIIHTQAGVDGVWSDPDYPPPNDDATFGNYWVEGTTSAIATARGYDSPRGEAHGSAEINLIHNPGFHFFTLVDAPSGQGEVNTIAQWVDVIRLEGVETLPSQIQIRVHVDAYVALSIEDHGVDQASARFGISDVGRFGGVGLRGSYPGNGFGFDSELSLGLVRWGEDFEGKPIRTNYFIDDNPLIQNLQAESLAADATSYASSISWDTTFDLFYSEELGGYILNLMAGAQSIGYEGGFALVDARNTMRLTDVTLTNGDPLPGNITFDSGFVLNSMNPVPEPGSLALLGTGAVGVIAAGRRGRQRRANVT